ncbi:hypothetical protein [Gordonia sp. (in: high G+C Gram-positive bacteria)]|uniref:hypothetical protein n=1 Tax=Gordonia sp. (in: high G+C Gram-positive bacteria) TaxID=84139 RepID=UPI003C75CC53
MPEIFTLDDANVDAAVKLIARGVAEIPLYQWLLGEHVDDEEKCEWLAELLLRPLQRVGCVVGAREEGRLVGVLVWQPHDVNLSPDGQPPITPADVAVAAQTPGLRERLANLWTTQPLPLPVEDAVCCVLSVVEPKYRGGPMLYDMTVKVEDFCHENDRPFYCWTGSSHVRDWFVRGWGAMVFDTREWEGRPMYGLVTERPPRRGVASAERRAAVPASATT